jgi:choline dehydrogenase-like flavoprotein
VESAVAAGFKRNDDFNGAEQEGAGLYQLTCKKGRRWSVADAYIHPASKRSNLTVRTEAFVMTIDVEGIRATGVTYRRGGVTQTARSNGEIILSAGAVASPQLLMLSGIGPGAHLREHGIDVKADIAGVGQNLQDHPVSAALFYTRDTTDLLQFLSFGNLLKAQKAGRGPMTSNGAEAGAFFKSRADMDAPDMQFHMLPTGFYDNALHEPVRRALVIAPTLVRVESTGYLKLRSADPTWHPEIEPGYFDDSADLDAMLAGYRRLYDVIDQGAIAKYIAGPWDPVSRNPTTDEIMATIARKGQTIYHPVGTCSMGTADGSVVDPQLKVHGVEGLRVADASVMPRVPRGNTNAPTIMIGEKCADLIKESR